MDLNKLKQYLIERINEIEDEETIRDIYQVIEENKMQVREPVQLTDLEKKALQKAERDINNGDVLTEEEANREIKNWL